MEMHLVASLVIAGVVALQNSTITCTAGVDRARQIASISCHFREDIRKTRRNFNVIRYPFDNKGGPDLNTANDVLLCNWIHEQNSLECKTDQSYTFDKNVDSSLMLDISRVSTGVAGVYVCQLVPDRNDHVEPCFLHANFTDELIDKEDDGQSSSESSTGLIIGILVPITLIIICSILLAIFRRQIRNYIKRPKSGNDTGSQAATRFPPDTDYSEPLFPGNGATTPTGRGEESTVESTAMITTEKKKDQIDESAPSGVLHPLMQAPYPELGHAHWTAGQVRAWLKDEQIDERVVELFMKKGVDGEKLDKLDTRKALRKLGVDEAQSELLKPKIRDLKTKQTKEVIS